MKINNQLKHQLKAKEYSSLPQRIMMEKWEASGRDLHTFGILLNGILLG